MTRLLVGLFAIAMMLWAAGAIANAVLHSALLSLFIAGVVMLGVSVTLTYVVLRRR